MGFIKGIFSSSFSVVALNNTCCELYYRFGMYLAPFTAMLTTVKHIKREEGDGHKCSLKRYENNELKNDD
jgi:hypothetical protein